MNAEEVQMRCAYCLTARTGSCLADQQLHTFPGPHIKGNDCAILSRAQEAVGLIWLQCKLVSSAAVLGQLLGLTVTIFG